MNKSTRRIFVSILTLVLTVVAVGTTTFAWFTIGNISTVSGIQAEVIGGEGLEIQIVRTDDTELKTEFKNTLSSADFATLIDADFRFRAVEFNGTDFEQMGVISDLGNNAIHGGLYQGVETTENVEYLSFTINFRSLSSGFVDLTNLTFIGEPTNLFYAGVEYTFADGTVILSEGETPSFDSENALRVTLGNNTYFNDHDNVNPLYGQWSYLLAKTNGKVFTDDTGNTQATPPPSLNAVVFSATNPTEIELDAVAESDGYFHGTIEMKVWVDGWDPYAFDAIYEQLLGITLSFEKRVTP